MWAKLLRQYGINKKNCMRHHWPPQLPREGFHRFLLKKKNQVLRYAIASCGRHEYMGMRAHEPASHLATVECLTFACRLQKVLFKPIQFVFARTCDVKEHTDQWHDQKRHWRVECDLCSAQLLFIICDVHRFGWATIILPASIRVYRHDVRRYLIVICGVVIAWSTVCQRTQRPIGMSAYMRMNASRLVESINLKMKWMTKFILLLLVCERGQYISK